MEEVYGFGCSAVTNNRVCQCQKIHGVLFIHWDFVKPICSRQNVTLSVVQSTSTFSTLCQNFGPKESNVVFTGVLANMTMSSLV